MLTITKLFENALATAKARKWDHVYIALDWHDTLTKSTYNSSTALEFYDDCIECLKLMSIQDKYKLILFTSSYHSKCSELESKLHDMCVYIDFINENPDVPNTEFGDFESKFYYNVLLDDKSGFEPESDWGELKQWLLINMIQEF
jgi:hypothetical protein